MAATKQIPREQLESYFDQLSRRFLRYDSSELADVEVLSPDLGDQPAVQGAHLTGVTYDPRSNALELELETGEHRVYDPQEVWVIEEPNGFVRSIEIVRDDGTREVVIVRRVGLQRADRATGS
jgi:hypothetical protein